MFSKLPRILTNLLSNAFSELVNIAKNGITISIGKDSKNEVSMDTTKKLINLK